MKVVTVAPAVGVIIALLHHVVRDGWVGSVVRIGRSSFGVVDEY